METKIGGAVGNNKAGESVEKGAEPVDEGATNAGKDVSSKESDEDEK